MKKFLTVLLALSVVFTYSFSAVGSVFAATDQENANTAMTNAQAAAEKAINDYAATIIYNQQGTLVTPEVDANLTKAAVDAGVAKAISDAKTAILNKAIELMADNAWSDADTAELNKLVPAADDIEELVFTTNATAIYEKAITDAKAAVTAAMNATTTTDYSNADVNTINVAKATATAALDAVKDNDKPGLTAVLAAGTAFTEAVKDLKTITVQENELSKAKTDAKAELAAAAEAYKAVAKAEYEATIKATDEAPTEIANATARLATLTSDVNKVVAFYNAAIDEVTLDVNGNPAVTSTEAVAAVNEVVADAKGDAFSDTDSFNAIVANLATTSLLIKYATDYATTLKNQFDKNTGLPVYNAATVDKALAEVVARINKLDENLNTYGKIAEVLDKTPDAAADAAALATAKTTAISDITTGSYAATAWDGDNKTAVEAIQEEYTNKINAATSPDAIEAAVKEAKDKMDAIPTTAILAEQKTKAEALVTELKYNESLTAYANGIAAKNPGAYADPTIAKVVEAAVKSFAEAVTAKNAKLTDAEIEAIVKGNYNSALAMIDGMKTTAQLDAAAAAVVNAIAALPAVPTLADKAQYLNVQKMLEDYLDTPGAEVSKVTNKFLMNSYMARIINLEKAAVEAAINALPANATAADEAAVEAAKAAYDAYKDAYSKYDAGDYNYGYTDISNATVLTDAATKVSDAKLTDAAKKVAAIPTNVTVEDKATVEAARAAYEALTDAEKASFNGDLLAKLEAAEKLIAALEVNAVESLKITASSSAVKGSITVKWTVKGDTSAADGFEVFRSLKMSSGYTNTAFYTTTDNTKRSYKNTKSLKKGTRYYYKLRAYKVLDDGTKIYSDWSNKAYRIAK